MQKYIRQASNKSAQHKLQPFRLTFLALSLWCVHGSAFALQELNEQSLRQVDGQDGLSINTQYSSIDIDRLYWEDKGGTPTGEKTLRGYADGIKISGNNLGTTYQINSGSDSAGKAGLDFRIDSRYGTISANSFKICDDAGNNCGNSIGGLTIQSQEDATLHFVTKDGLFNKNELANADIAIKRMNIYLTQKQSASAKNQLIAQDFNFNFSGVGYIYIDDLGGLVLKTGTTGQVDLQRVCIDVSCPTFTATNSKPGINIDFVLKDGSDNTFNTTGAKGLIRVGASGIAKNSELSFRGTNGNDATGVTVLGNAYTVGDAATNNTIIGSSGLAMRLKTDFTSTGSNPTTLELAHGGSKAYGLSFSNFTPLLVRKQDGGGNLNSELAYFDSGNIYLNLANTKSLQLPTASTDVLRNLKLGATTLTTAPDYLQQVHNLTVNPDAVIIATRGTDFQALSRQTKFIASPDMTQPDNTGGTWGLGLPFYNLNTNLAIYGATFTGTPYGSAPVTGSERLGFALQMSTKGINYDRSKTLANQAAGDDGSKTTSILLIDGKKYSTTSFDATTKVRNADTNGDPINYYVGIRNIDMLLSGYGSIGLENTRLNILVSKFTLAASGEVAVGYLLGSQYKTSLGGIAKYAPINGFADNKDVLFGLRLRMQGDIDMTMVPGDNTDASKNYISFEGNMNLTDGAVQVVEPTDSSIVGFDTISGKIGFKNAIKINDGNVDFNTAFVVNPNKTPTDVLRVKNLNFYPANNGVIGSAQRLGEMAITGGRITSTFNITPH